MICFERGLNWWAAARHLKGAPLTQAIPIGDLGQRFIHLHIGMQAVHVHLSFAMRSWHTGIDLADHHPGMTHCGPRHVHRNAQRAITM